MNPKLALVLGSVELAIQLATLILVVILLVR
jgi:hypothetical protein